MSKSIKYITLLGFVVTVAACGGGQSAQEEYVVIEPEPISVEPVYTGKLK